MPRRKNPGLAGRIERVMHVMHWTRAELARQLGCEQSAVSNWIRRNQGIEAHYAFVLQDKYAWSARWLLEGSGPERIALLSAEDERILQQIRELPQERRRALALVLGIRIL